MASNENMKELMEGSVYRAGIHAYDSLNNIKDIILLYVNRETDFLPDR